MQFVRLLWITTRPGRAWVGSVSNKDNPSTKSGLGACISSRITTVIHVMNDHQINYNCFNEPFAVSPYRSLYWDMHGLIFETSIWLLAGSTRFMHHHWPNIRSLKKTAAWETCLTQWNATKDFSTDQRHSAGIEDTIRTYNLTLGRQTSRVWHCKHTKMLGPQFLHAQHAYSLDWEYQASISTHKSRYMHMSASTVQTECPYVNQNFM